LSYGKEHGRAHIGDRRGDIYLQSEEEAGEIFKKMVGRRRTIQIGLATRGRRGPGLLKHGVSSGECQLAVPDRKEVCDKGFQIR